MAVLDPINSGWSDAEVAEERYWRVVGETLDRLFAQDDPSRAAEYRRRLAEYRGKLRSVSLEEQSLVYHAEPLDVAADIAGQKPTPKLLRAYDELVETLT